MQKASSDMTLDTHPNEVLYNIMSRVETEDIKHLRLVNKSVYGASTGMLANKCFKNEPIQVKMNRDYLDEFAALSKTPIIGPTLSTVISLPGMMFGMERPTMRRHNAEDDCEAGQSRLVNDWLTSLKTHGGPIGLELEYVTAWPRRVFRRENEAQYENFCDTRQTTTGRKMLDNLIFHECPISRLKICESSPALRYVEALLASEPESVKPLTGILTGGLREFSMAIDHLVHSVAQDTVAALARLLTSAKRLVTVKINLHLGFPSRRQPAVLS